MAQVVHLLPASDKYKDVASLQLTVDLAHLMEGGERGGEGEGRGEEGRGGEGRGGGTGRRGRRGGDRQRGEEKGEEGKREEEGNSIDEQCAIGGVHISMPSVRTLPTISATIG